MNKEEFQELFEAYSELDIATNPCLEPPVVLTEGSHPSYISPYDEDEDDEDFGHYLTACTEDSDIGQFDSKFSNEMWEIEVPQEMIDRIQQEYLDYKTGDDDRKFPDYVWYELWPNIKPEQVDPMQAAADYYLLFGIVSNAFVEYEPIYIPTFEEIQNAGRKLRKTFKEIEERNKFLQLRAEGDPRAELTNIKDQADLMFHDLVEKLDSSFREYVHLACGGELRYHESVNKALPNFRKGSWVHWKFIFDKYGVEAVDKMAEMFLEFPDSAYGGPAWSDAAMILAQRERGELGPDEFTNKQLFVDRVFTLEHNGGCFLNKLEWVNKREHLDTPYCYHFESMTSTVLELHSDDELNIDEMVKYASAEIVDIVTRYLDLAREYKYTINGRWRGLEANFKSKISQIKGPEPAMLIQDEIAELDWSAELDGQFVLTHKEAEAMKAKMIESFKTSPVMQDLKNEETAWF
jgi:hypothetical protein